MYKFTTAAKDWLVLILEERFGHFFELAQSQSGLKLSLSSISQSYILFPNLEEAFHLSRSDFPHSHWDANNFGWISPMNESLPAPCVNKLPNPLIEIEDTHSIIKYDILGLTYWVLNRIEEIDRTDLDSHGRFPAIASHAYINNYLERPVIDEWMCILAQVIRHTWPTIDLKVNEFSIKVSHDVDVPSRYGFGSAKDVLRSMTGDLIKRRDFKNALLGPLIRINSKKKLHHADPFNTFNWIMEQSENNNLTSAFYFICGRTDNEKDANYELDHLAIRKLMRDISERGHEIGLHPSYNSFQKAEVIEDEANYLRQIMQEEGIEQNILGGRMHYLRWEHPKTLQAWNDAGMTYDSTLTYAARPGFRCGTCFEYRAFNPATQQILDIRIRPLIAMECSIVSKEYLGLGKSNEALEKLVSLRDKCKSVNGCFTLLWHNDGFYYAEDRYMYLNTIKH